MSDRKYRHRGYQDGDREDRERKPPRTDQRGQRGPDGAPRGRGVGSPTVVTFKCSVCGHELRDLSIDTDTPCPSCGKPVRTCTNCSFFNPSARFECRKPLEARVENKAKANQCQLFQPKAIRDLRAAKPEKTTDARAEFDALFKK
jgi:predicted RNA-binding Zn-ribbon protein involved in translation (DUF1610 family)